MIPFLIVSVVFWGLLIITVKKEWYMGMFMTIMALFPFYLVYLIGILSATHRYYDMVAERASLDLVGMYSPEVISWNTNLQKMQKNNDIFFLDPMFDDRIDNLQLLIKQ